MSDLTAEDRAALLAASMACAHAQAAAWRAYEKLMDVEVRRGKNAKDHEGNYLTDRLSHARVATVDLCHLMHVAMMGGEGVRWE